MSLEFEKEQTQQTSIEFKQLESEEPKKEEAADLQKDDQNDTEDQADTQLDLFGDSIQEVQDNQNTQNAQGSKKPKKNNTSSNKKKTTSKEEKFGVDYTVYYAGHTIQVPNDDMTLEEIRQYLEEEFPELSKERTEMTVNKEKKSITPIVKGSKKG